jgi:hypothetical protein
MQAVPVLAPVVRISMAVQMFAPTLLAVFRLLLFLLVPLGYLTLQQVAELFRPSGRSPIHSNTSQLRHSLREWRFGMTIQTEIRS